MVFPRLADAAPPQSSSALGPVSPAFLADVVPAGVHPSELVKRRAVLCRPFRRLAADPAPTSPGGHVLPDIIENLTACTWAFCEVSSLATGFPERSFLFTTWLAVVVTTSVETVVTALGTARGSRRSGSAC